MLLLRSVTCLPKGPLYDCVRKLAKAASDQNPAWVDDPQNYLTYEIVLDIFDEAVTAALESEALE